MRSSCVFLLLAIAAQAESFLQALRSDAVVPGETPSDGHLPAPGSTSPDSLDVVLAAHLFGKATEEIAAPATGLVLS